MNEIAQRMASGLALAVALTLSIQRGIAADECAAAKATAREYLELVPKLAENGFTDETQLKRQNQLLDTPPSGHNLGYYIYTSASIESCSVRGGSEARLVLSYELAGHVGLDPKKPRDLPAFSEIEAAKHIVVRFRAGRLSDLTAHDPFYPPIVAIQDYRDRMEIAAVADKTKYRKVLEVLDSKQKKYMRDRDHR